MSRAVAGGVLADEIQFDRAVGREFLASARICSIGLDRIGPRIDGIVQKVQP